MVNASELQSSINKSQIHQKIRFLEDQLVSLDHYLPETYEYLMHQLDLQRRQLVEIETSETFLAIDDQQSTLFKKGLES